MSASRLRRLLLRRRGPLTFVLLRGVSQALEFLALLLAARTLQPAPFGALSAGYLIGRYGGLIADAGASLGGARDVARSAGTVHVPLLRRRRAAGTVLAAVFVVACHATGWGRLSPLAALILAAGLQRDWVALGRGQEVRSAIPGFVRGTAAIVGMWFATSLETTAWVLGVAAMTGGLLSVKLNRVEPDPVRRSSPGWLLLGTLSAQVYATSDVLLLGYLEDGRSAGLYSAAYRLPLVWYTVVTLGAQSLIRRLTLATDQEGGAALGRRIVSIASVGIPVLGVVALMSRVAFVPLFGEDYREALSAMTWLWIAMAFVTLSAPLSIVYLASVGDRPYACVLTAGAVTNLVGNVLLIPHYGRAGAAAMTATAEVVVLLLMASGLRGLSRRRTLDRIQEEAFKPSS